MKTKSERLTNFCPIRLEITIESQSELDALASLFNTVAVDSTMEEMGFATPETISSELSARGANAGLTKEVSDLLRKYLK